LVALSKCDALTPDVIAEKSDALTKAARKKPLALSAVSGLGMKEALYAITREIRRRNDKEDAEREEAEGRPAWRP
ncbi:MAG: GTPase ObgE, partial [Proteobacteria bacterium]|nr:GTPase ObgE [Pseudomonadota bacterium]